MASIKLVYGSSTETCWSSTGKITTPSLILNDGGTLRYTPLFSGNAGAKVINGDYYYTLGHLIVGGKRVSIARSTYRYYYTNTLTAKYKIVKSYSDITTGSGTSAVTTRHYYVKYYVAKTSQSIQYGTGGAVSCAGGNSTTSSSWALIKTNDSTSGYSVTHPNLQCQITGGSSWNDVSVTWSETEKSYTWSKSGSYTV